MHTVESDSLVWCTPWSLTPRWNAHFFIFYEYLGEIEKEFENDLAFSAGAQMGSNHEKNIGRKSRDTLRLSQGAL